MPEQEPGPELPTANNSNEQRHIAPPPTHNQQPTQSIFVPHPDPDPIPIPTAAPPLLPSTTATPAAAVSTPPTPAQLASITAPQLQGIRLLYPGLRDVPAPCLREAVYAHRRYLVQQKLRACADVSVGGDGGGGGVVSAGQWSGSSLSMRTGYGQGHGQGTAQVVARYRAGRPDLGWVSDGGVLASVLFDGERARWLREGWAVEMEGAGGGTGMGTGMGTDGTGARQGMVGWLVGEAEPMFEPTDEEISEFKAQCEVMVRTRDRHVRSVISYLRRRRWKKERERDMEDGIRFGLGTVGLEGRRDVERLAVPVGTIRQRIGELRRVGGMDRANVLRVEELQRLLEVERATRFETSDGYRGGTGMVDRGVQTTMVSCETQGLTSLPPVDTVEDGEVDDEESDTDGGMDLDEESYYSGETIESEGYQDHHDLFDEFHGRLL